MVNLRLSFFELFNSNFHILKVLSQISLKISMYYRKTLFLCIPKYFQIQNSSFQENVITKVYALEDSLGIDLIEKNVNHLQALFIWCILETCSWKNMNNL